LNKTLVSNSWEAMELNTVGYKSAEKDDNKLICNPYWTKSEKGGKNASCLRTDNNNKY